MNTTYQILGGFIGAIIISIFVGRLINEFWNARQLRLLKEVRELLRYQVLLAGGEVKLTQDENDLITRLDDETLDLVSAIEQHKASTYFVHPVLGQAIETYTDKREKKK